MKELAQDGNKSQPRQSDATGLTSTLCPCVNKSWASKKGRDVFNLLVFHFQGRIDAVREEWGN